MTAESTALCVADVHAVLGEGPLWVERDAALYWVDIKGRKIFRVDAAGERREWATPFRVGSIAPRASGGRFWAGTMDDTEQHSTGTLYRIDPDLAATPVDTGYKVTNGPAFSPSGAIMYHNDSARQGTYAFDLDGDGNATNRRVFATYGEGDGYPDGMTADAEGCLWVAFWDGWCVRRYSPAGACIAKLDVPVSKPTSCAFGGPDLDQLYISSASIGLDERDLADQAQAGGVFVPAPGVRGVPELPFSGRPKPFGPRS